MQAAVINGCLMHYADQGAGAPVVFANSLGTDMRVWDRLIARLPEGLRIIRYDKRGHGLSGLPEDGWGMGDLVQDLAALLDRLEVRGAAVVGLSIGGMIAQGLAAERPDLVRAMVLMDTAAKIGAPGMWDARIAAIRAGGVEAVADQVLERWFSRATRAARPDELALWRNMLTRTPVEGYLGCCAAIRDTDLLESTARLRLPTLALAGDEDGSTPPDLVRETAALIPGARFALVRGAGHLPGVERPDETARLILDFLKENGFA
ncbi:3-oxoadipate enol-lactonase [Oceanicella actignis]|uniref:3-oxoadipate enol-lactonase n=1 Tax=Oceanicella actignis TaxID=1189325 RepID=A0A1M7TG02_9RHOB|nr:3-oxoadipate enol-lactonase [Oceanicella actignis]SET60608.1 3-oxoadipate enol-lactonase [Oceanicella actignis]SHN69647.1 3-oxoadipate enol-lactonase [Oceanicella actignis]